ncbi:MAG TPA: VOC family protein [Burkholderiaceae bacterium]|nr:VOC family protein [Burkholderiaceae bacterium]
MLFGKLFHTAIKTADLEATVRFYTEVLGMVVADRPPIGFPGAWLKPAQADTEASFHIYAGDAAKEADGSVQTGSGAVDHVSVVCQGYSDFKAQFEKHGLPYRENVVPATPLWQLFVFDPNGIQLELTFHAAAEREPPPVIAAQHRYSARERWFQQEAYRQFSAR